MNKVIEGKKILEKQVSALWGMSQEEMEMLDCVFEKVEIRLEKCFSKIKNKYYNTQEGIVFSPYHSCQYSFLLYFYSDELFKKYGDNDLSSKIYCTLKMCSTMDLFYQIEMPEVFFFDHPVGTVLGRACYGNNFLFMQNCTVGNNRGIYPNIGENVIMMSGAKILGNCSIGNNVILSANCYVLDTDIPDNSIVWGGYNPRELKIVQNKERIDELINTFFIL